MSDVVDRTETVTAYVSLSTLSKASEGIALCGWQGERQSLTRDDSLFRQFSIYYPPKDREGSIPDAGYDTLSSPETSLLCERASEGYIYFG